MEVKFRTPSLNVRHCRKNPADPETVGLIFHGKCRRETNVGEIRKSSPGSALAAAFQTVVGQICRKKTSEARKSFKTRAIRGHEQRLLKETDGQRALSAMVVLLLTTSKPEAPRLSDKHTFSFILHHIYNSLSKGC